MITSALLLGTGILVDRDMVPRSFDYNLGSSADTLRRFLKVERSIKKLITPKRNTLADDY